MKISPVKAVFDTLENKIDKRYWLWKSSLEREKKGLPQVIRKRMYWETNQTDSDEYTDHHIPEISSNKDYNDATEHHS